MNDIFKFIEAVGVPGAIALFVLWRVDTGLQGLIREVRSLHEAIRELLQKKMEGE